MFNHEPRRIELESIDVFVFSPMFFSAIKCTIVYTLEIAPASRAIANSHKAQVQTKTPSYLREHVGNLRTGEAVIVARSADL